MSSDQGQTQVGGIAASGVSQVGGREGGLSQKDKRQALDNASVTARLKDDRGEAMDAALTDSTFMAKTDGDLKNLSGADLIQEMMNNPLTQAKSGTAWAQVNIAKAGLGKELDKLIEGTPIVEERQYLTNIQQLLSGKSIAEMDTLQVKALQQNLEGLGIYAGEVDGDRNNKGLVAALEGIVLANRTIETAMKGGRAALPDGSARLAFFDAKENTTPKITSQPSGEARIMALFKENDAQVSQRAAQTAQPPATTRRLDQSLSLA